jgi:hypothetical protein
MGRNRRRGQQPSMIVLSFLFLFLFAVGYFFVVVSITLSMAYGTVILLLWRRLRPFLPPEPNRPSLALLLLLPPRPPIPCCSRRRCLVSIQEAQELQRRPHPLAPRHRVESRQRGPAQRRQLPRGRLHVREQGLEQRQQRLAHGARGQRGLCGCGCGSRVWVWENTSPASRTSTVPATPSHHSIDRQMYMYIYVYIMGGRTGLASLFKKARGRRSAP